MSRYRRKSEAIPHKYSVMLFWSGLRGAVAFALAAGLEGENANAMKTTILVVVVLSVIVFGGTTSRVLEIMKIQTGVEEDGDSSDDELSDLAFVLQRLIQIMDVRHEFDFPFNFYI